MRATWLALILCSACQTVPQPTRRAELDRFWTQLVSGVASVDDVVLPDCLPLVDPRLITVWRTKEPMWPAELSDEVRVLLGPPMPAMTTVCLRRAEGVWHFAGWMPGD